MASTIIKINYLHSEWNDYPYFVQGLVEQHRARTICGIGGGKPFLEHGFINSLSGAAPDL